MTDYGLVCSSCYVESNEVNEMNGKVYFLDEGCLLAGNPATNPPNGENDCWVEVTQKNTSGVVGHYPSERMLHTMVKVPGPEWNIGSPSNGVINDIFLFGGVKNQTTAGRDPGPLDVYKGTISLVDIPNSRDHEVEIEWSEIHCGTVEQCDDAPRWRRDLSAVYYRGARPHQKEIFVYGLGTSLIVKAVGRVARIKKQLISKRICST